MGATWVVLNNAGSEDYLCVHSLVESTKVVIFTFPYIKVPTAGSQGFRVRS